MVWSLTNERWKYDMVNVAIILMLIHDKWLMRHGKYSSRCLCLPRHTKLQIIPLTPCINLTFFLFNLSSDHIHVKNTYNYQW